jgi:aerobic-type carbon monoxide dehydrogenase small subunit (CoxS/CutS family)
MSEEHLIGLTVNGQAREVVVSPRTSLAQMIREDIGLKGTHVTCQMGICGVCTVILDGDAVRSCIILAVQADGTRIETVESLGSVNEPSPLQQAFVEENALQCGFCTPGFLTLCTSYLRKRPDATDEELRGVVASNLCRCTGYRGIMRAARKVRDELSSQHAGEE